jgi:hypothetical protein
LDPQEALGVGLVVAAATFHRGDASSYRLLGLLRPATMMFPL